MNTAQTLLKQREILAIAVPWVRSTTVNPKMHDEAGFFQFGLVWLGGFWGVWGFIFFYFFVAVTAAGFVCN